MAMIRGAGFDATIASCWSAYGAGITFIRVSLDTRRSSAGISRRIKRLSFLRIDVCAKSAVNGAVGQCWFGTASIG